MEKLLIGKLVNTHGIKGEVRIISDFEYKENVFKKGNNLIINHDNLVISSYRKHKNYDMVTFGGINDINEVLQYKGYNVYINRDEYEFDGYLNADLIGLYVFDLAGNYHGTIMNILKGKQYDLFVVKDDTEYMIPYISEFVKKIDLNNKKVIIDYIKGLKNED